jgi:hypothetical protein
VASPTGFVGAYCAPTLKGQLASLRCQNRLTDDFTDPSGSVHEGINTIKKAPRGAVFMVVTPTGIEPVLPP